MGKKEHMLSERQLLITLWFTVGGQRAYQGAKGATARAQGGADAEGAPTAYPAGTRGRAEGQVPAHRPADQNQGRRK